MLADYCTRDPRPGQTRCFSLLDKCLPSSDVVVIRADVGEGKSLIAETLVRAAASTKSGLGLGGGLIGVPNNLLLTQYLSSCRGLDTIRRADLYKCHSFDGSCSERKKEVGKCCTSASGNMYSRDACSYLRDLRRARSSGKMCVTYHASMAHSLSRDLLVVDEAHNLRPFLRDLASRKMWRHEYKWGRPIRSVADCVRWLSDEIPASDQDESTDLLWSTLTGPRPQYMVDFQPQEFRGQERECISLIPLDVRNRPCPLWPRGVRKIVLMSATINRLDISALGLDRRRVTYIDLPSSIPPEQRRVVYRPVADMRFAGRGAATEKMARWIVEEYLPTHPGRGLIHATYEVAEELQRLLPGGRLMFHGRQNKQEVLSRFLAGGAGQVLVGSGMHEGLDLQGDLARHQLVTSIPRGNVGDPATAWLAENKPQEYEWDTIRELIQMSGRVCRGADDFGETTIADSSFGARELNSDLIPASWRAALHITPTM